jgi:flavin reductase (DIM6/NTAB) family NADH-FMN oxidoreductase RutF
LHPKEKEKYPAFYINAQEPVIYVSAKTQVNISSAYRLLHPMHIVLVSCVGKTNKPNVTTVAWAMPTSINPPLLAISLAPTRHTHTLIEESGEFTVNIPTLEILQAVYSCGSLTGRSFDKFKKANLTQMPGKKVKAPAVRECIAHLECEVDGQMVTGDHTIFVGKILEAYADMGVFSESGYDLKKARVLYHAGGNNFALLDPKLYKS